MALVGAAVSAAGLPAQAGVYADDLGRCLVKSTSPADRQTFIVWMFTAMSTHPDIKSYAVITDAQRMTVNTTTAQLFERLLTVDCRAETVAAAKYEGGSAMETAFNTFGQVAARGLAENPEVNKSMTEFAAHMDMKKLQDLARDAGQPPAAKP